MHEHEKKSWLLSTYTQCSSFGFILTPLEWHFGIVKIHNDHNFESDEATHKHKSCDNATDIDFAPSRPTFKSLEIPVLNPRNVTQCC